MIADKNYKLLEQANGPPNQYNYQSDPSMKDDLPPVCFFRMFRFADKFDYLLLAIGLVCAALNGVSLVFYANPYGQLTESFAPNVDKQWIVDQTKDAVFGFLKNSVLVFFGSWFMTATWTISSQRQSIRCRQEYLRALLRQEPAWHDRRRSTELAQKMYTETNQLQNAIGSKISGFLMSTSMVIGGVTIALLRGWKMALVLLGFVPVMLVAGAVSTRVSKRADAKTNRIATRLSGEALQVLENVRTVKVLGGEEYELDRYSKGLELLMAQNTYYGWIKSFISSLCYFCVIMNYTLGFWFGSILVSRQEYNQSTKDIYSVADVIVVFFTIYTSNLNLGQIPDCLAAFDIGAKASARIHSIIDRPPLIVSGSHSLPLLDQILLSNITFRYDQPLFENVTFKIRKGKTAFVGESGSGKSTIVNLVMRFYDPLSGQVLFNSINIKEFSLTGLRDTIGYVGQEPVLLGKTIREALVAENRDETQIVRALKLAEAWTFVKDIGLDKQYGMLSGGQKQRVAIARSILKNPQILILDQATSALDRRNQKQIQNTLNNLHIPFMIMVAHKIETVEKADYIYVLEKGKIVEEGGYKELIGRKGKFYELAIKQGVVVDRDSATKPAVDNSRPKSVEEEAAVEAKSKARIQANAQKKQQQQKKEDQPEFHWRYIWNMFKMNSAKGPYLVLGVICTIFIGCVFPLFSFFLSRLIVVLSAVKYSPAEDRQQYVDQAHTLSFNLLMISVAAYVACAFRGAAFVSVQQRLTYLMKKQVLEKLLKMKISYFDKKGTAYCSTILSDVNVANKLASSLLWDIFENSATLICGLGIAFVSCWQMTMIALSVLPVLLVAGKLQAHFVGGFSSDTDIAYKKAHEKVVQALLNYKTVLGFNLQEKLTQEYYTLLQEPMRISVKRGNIAGISFGLAQSLISCIFALIFFVGALLIRDRGISVLAVYTSIYAIMFSAMSAGGNLHFVSSIIDSKTKLLNVMQVIEDSDNQEVINEARGTRSQKLTGNLELKNVTFRYPQRDIPVFENFSLKIQAGTKVALVGTSGCGKSTVLSLLLKLYQPESGDVLIDGRNILDYHLWDLRSRIGVVSQEPVLFNRSVYDNIKYNRREVKYPQVLQATRQANAYQFIQDGKFGISDQKKVTDDNAGEAETEQEQDVEASLITVRGFFRKVGIKGGFLSGGQKQRIAIARTLVRKPELMLLDEATSALDSVNEQLVQQALESIHNVTQVIVAHRLSTIRRCDKIYVFDKGRIVEEGQFQELLSKKGHFYNLAQGNSLK